MYDTKEELLAVIHELDTDINVIQRAIALTKANQNAVNHTLYQGRLEAYDSVLGILRGSRTVHEFDLRKVTKK